MKAKPLFAALGLITSLAACSTVPFGGDIVNSHVNAAGIGWGPVTGVTAGYLSTNHTFVPALGKDSKGNLIQLNYAENCGRNGPPAVESVQAGNATANASSSQTGVSAAPSLQIGVAVNQGLWTGEAARIDELSKLQAAMKSGSAMTEYNACPQSVPTQATAPATGAPVQ